MLSFEVRALEAQAAKVDGSLSPDDDVWMPEDTRPDAPVAVTGRVSVAGRGRYRFNGRFEGTITLDCRRCLTPVSVAVAADAEAIIADAESEDLDDPDLYALSDGGRRVDLRPAIREQWLLNAPAFVLCRPDCRGLCPTCGADLNAGPCPHVPATSSLLST
ncbi:MAG TPA: DUF177 domain-containing protein [Gemmatimonadaceae bacterium]|nr:DUF177 domain-containing protein [Gemmatimonadaceae bacterium]